MPVASTKADWARAAAELAVRHELAATLLERHGPPTGIRRTPAARRFGALAQAIAYQQLSGRAAATIWGRVEATVGDCNDPAALLATAHQELRAAGLSEAKSSALHDLATKAAGGELDLAATVGMDDAEVVDHLCQVRGIGPWTAQMYLIFDLGRTDVWPAGDLGVRAGWAKATEAAEVPPERGFEGAGRPFTPHRSVMAWWCWRELDSAGSPK